MERVPALIHGKMRLRVRRLAPGEFDHELLWLSVSLSTLFLAAGWLATSLPWPRCMFHEITGLPCVTCGMTRSAIAFFHGHILAALKWNPLVFVFLCGAMVFDLYAFVVLVTRAPRLRFVFGQTEKKYARGVVICALALNWIYLLSHHKAFA
jgi:Protein of unknown function (DUF2752)